MNKNEKKIFTDQYKVLVRIDRIIKIDKYDSIREFKILLDSLNLKSERYKVENEILAEERGYTASVIDMFIMISNTFEKYNRFIHHDIIEISECYDNLQYEMSDEDKHCHIARIKYIIEKILS